MADVLVFDAGKNTILDGGIPTTSNGIEWALSDRSVEGGGTQHKAADTLGGGVGKITGTGYTDKKATAPSAASGKKSFSAVEWETGSATDWPASVRSAVLIIGSVAVAAFNLRTGGSARDMSAANTSETFTGTLTLS